MGVLCILILHNFIAAKCQGRDAPPEHEVKILSMVSHPNVVEMFEQYDFSNELYIVLELIEVI